MHAKPRTLLLSTALVAALFTATPALAQDAGTDAEIVAQASVPASRLAERYTELAGSPEAAAELVTQLRGGEDFTVIEEVTTTTTNADGTTTTTTALVERSVVNPNGAMGFGEVNITLALAQALVDGGVYPDLQSALTGASTTVTNPDGTTTTTVEGGVLTMRADGQGWGQIAKELGFKLGALVSASNNGGKTDAAASAKAERQGKVAKVEKVAKIERTAKVERVDKVERLVRPEKPERPVRPERPQKPERGGGR